jgi:uncharacterized protein
MIKVLKDKKILVLGSTGRVGQKLVEYSLSSGAMVKAFLRDPMKLNLSHENLIKFTGDVLLEKEVLEAMVDIDVVFSTLSGRSTKPDYSVLSIGIQNILTAMQSSSVKRILNVGGAGILKDPQYGLRRDKPGYPSFFRNVSAENLKVLDFLESSNVNWTMVCAPEMPDADLTKEYRVEVDYLPENGNRISVEDVAHFMLENIENDRYYCKKIGIAY